MFDRQSPTSAGKPLLVAIGSRIEIRTLDRSGQSEKLEFTIVPDLMADFANGYLGQSTPLAKALLGQHIGSAIPYEVGDMKEVHILNVTPGEAELSDEAAARRREETRKATREVERTNAINFASSFSGKWGDYDPESIDKEV